MFKKSGAYAAAVLTALVLAPWLITACLPLHTRTQTPAAGAKAADFSLQDQAGKTATLSGLLERGPAVIVFYRGYW